MQSACKLACFFFSSRRRHTRCGRDWSSDVCSSDLGDLTQEALDAEARGELGMKHLDRNRSLVLQVDRQKNRRHPAAAHRAVDGVTIREAGFQTSEEGGQVALLAYG